jgi:glucan phosphoethanolaminetransferase (alkaline phosphatase superfamily)
VTPQPTDDSAPAPSMPASVRVATIAMAILAALFLAYGGLLWFGFDTAVANTVGDGDTVTRSEAEAFIRTSVIVFLVLGVVLALSAWFLPRRQPWARWLGIAVNGLLVLLSLFTMATAGGIPIYTLLVLILALAALTSLFARTTGAFVPRLGVRS